MPIFLQPFKKYADFKGRARRKEYWGFLALIYGVTFAAGFALGLAGVPFSPEVKLAFNLVALPVFLPSIAVAIRRLHDSNRSGWWLLVAIFGGILAQATAALLAFHLISLTLAACLAVTGAIIALSVAVMLLLPGTAGENRFGPNPRDPQA